MLLSFLNFTRIADQDARTLASYPRPPGLMLLKASYCSGDYEQRNREELVNAANQRSSAKLAGECDVKRSNVWITETEDCMLHEVPIRFPADLVLVRHSVAPLILHVVWPAYTVVVTAYATVGCI